MVFGAKCLFFACFCEISYFDICCFLFAPTYIIFVQARRMNYYLIYLILLGAIALFGGIVLFISKRFPNKKHLIIERILTFVLMAVFAVRFMSYIEPQIQEGNFSYFAFLGGPQNKAFNFFGNIAIWLEITAMLMLLLRPFFNFKTSKWYVKFISSPIFFVCMIALEPMISMMQNGVQYSVPYFLLPIEIGLAAVLCAYYWFKDYKVKISKHSYVEVAVFSVLINFATMPPFIPYFFFGLGNIDHHIYDFSIYHRLFIYILLIILPLFIYFSMRRASKDKIDYNLIFISVGTMIVFLTYNKYDMFMEPWRWPLHLCNTAMFLMPICYIFKPKRLFYFTYFINVFGAVLAMLMPNYSKSMTIMDPYITYFWVNHAIAFFMPLLGVALHVFERPKMKQYFYSLAWFAGYFLLVLIINPVIEGLTGHNPDFFFINGLFIADKLGDWAKNIFNISLSFSIGSVKFTFHPIYQLIYFVVYGLVGFGVWFVYQLFFDISDSHYDLHLRLKGIRLDNVALKSQLNGRSIDEPMEKNAGISLKLDHFSKRYGLNTYYSVKDANLEVHSGEVFGFLGPNGAGKSTIIKSMVGIQPITSGDIYVCGYNIKSQPVFAKSKIGFVPDHYALYEKLTGREYLNYIADIYEVSQEDRDARLEEYIRIFELENSIDNKIKTYSHGMKQKITIIAALVHNPEVWILDEPLTGLDPTSIYQVKECMRKHAEKGNVVFFSSHLIDIVEKLCDRIAIIKHGQIRCITTVKEIEATGKSLEEFYMSVITTNEEDPRK